MKKVKLALIAILFLSISETGWSQKLPFAQGEIIVQLKPSTNVPAWLRQHASFEGKFTQIALKKELVAKPMQIASFSFDFTTINEYDFLEYLRKDEQVEIAQFNHFVQLRSTTPNDPSFDQQWQYINTGQSGGTIGVDFDIDLAWDLTTGGVTATGDTIVVCVIDNGFQFSHNDFGDNIWVNKFEIPNNDIDDDNNGFIDDFQGWNTGSDSDNVGIGGSHGTPVAGIIGAKGNNSLGVSGVNWDVKLMIVRNTSGLESEIISAYAFPLAHRMRYNETDGEEGAFVVATNASWGLDFFTPDDAPIWCAFYDTLGTHGILNCAATTNDERDVDIGGDLPSNCPSDFLLTVTNLDHNNEIEEAGFGAISVDLGAFGEETFTVGPNNSYSGFGGTSAAAPHVTGTIGLLYALPCPAFMALAKANPSEAALLIREAILEGTVPNESLDEITVTGGGLNIYNSALILNQICGDCPGPLNVHVSDLTDVSAALNWTPNDSINRLDLRWRNIGAIEWNEAEDVSSPFLLSDLTPCTGYEFQLKAYCNLDTLDFSESYTFKTDGCCVPPTEVNFAQSGISGPVLASWESILAAESYNIRIREGALGDWMTFSTTDPSFQFDDLMTCTNYQIQVQTVCENMTTDFGPTQFLLTLGCGACTEIEYCNPPGNIDSDAEWIARVELNDLDNSSESDEGYGDYSGISPTQLQTGSSYTIQLTPGFDAQAFSEYFLVWIDYNQDGTFETTEVIFDSGFASTETVNGEFEVPVGAVQGITRMRVVMQFNSAGGPCALMSPAFGEIEDYCVEIIPGDLGECTTPLNLDTLSVGTTEVFLEWNPVPAALNYLLRFRPTGQEVWTILNVLPNQFSLPGLSFCTEYEFQVRSVCNEGGSIYSSSLIFSTSCSTSADDVNEAFPELSIFPNPFNQTFHINMKLSQAAKQLKLSLFNSQGQMVQQETLGAFVVGEHSIPIEVQAPAGIYWLKIENEQGAFINRKLIKMD